MAGTEGPEQLLHQQITLKPMVVVRVGWDRKQQLQQEHWFLHQVLA
jgi:hypothetical protein